jgi:hypothetical protein
MLQYSVLSKPIILFKFWDEVEEEEWRCIYILIFSVLNENRIHSDKDTGMEHLIHSGIHFLHMVESANENPVNM